MVPCDLVGCCTFGHAEAYYDSLYTLPLEEEGADA